MDQYANLFLLYFLLNFAFILGLIIGSVAGFPKNRENAVTAVLFAVTTVDLFLMMGLLNLYLG
ncbi:hypothetical protein QDY65_05525 [Pyrococcus kukulkanii]|uniref:hypothetical protein n=1 Tax=Pyrococcus kukulkanii TaxID=1609559 RepID=UPI00356547BA